MKNVTIIATVWAVGGCLGNCAWAQKVATTRPATAGASAAVLLEKGIYTEETVGDLDAAIKVYQQIIDDTKANRQYAARAQYRLGMCYLKKGDKAKAAAELRQLLASYPQEKDIAAQAQKELAKLSPPLRGTAAFGPVIEKTLNDVDDGQGREGLDIQSGRQFDVPKEAKGWSKAQHHQWIKENGIDLFVDYARNRWALIVGDLKLEGIEQRWDDINPHYLQTATASETSKIEMMERSGYRIYVLHEKAMPPLNFAFKTAKGELGVLQIVEFMDKPRGVKIRYKLLEYGPAPVADAAPRVVKTSPVAFDNDVDPSLDKITVTFDRPMTDKSWSWTGGGETFPKIQTPSYNASKTTCTLPVKLQPGKVYWVGVNSPSHRNFKSADGTAAARYVILFATKSADGKPTPLPDDMARRARAINEASAQAAMPRLPDEVMAYIVGEHLATLRTAQEKQLRTNTRIYGVDDRFALYSGGLLGYVNSSDKPQAGPIHLGNFGREKPDFTLMDEASRPQEFELRDRPDATFGKYGLWWKPSQPVQPGASSLLGYIGNGTKMLPLTGGMARLSMENTFGSQVLESFFLVLPRGMTIVEPSGKPTSKTTIGQCDVYLWRKQVPFNTKHMVTMGLTAQRVASDAEIAKIVDNAVTDISTMADGDSRIPPLLASLAELREPAVVKAVAKYFDSDKDTFRRAAVYIIWKDTFSDPSPALAGLIKLCSHKEDMTRGMAALALGTMKAGSAFDTLADMTANDKSPFARRCAAYALGILGDQKAKPILEKALKDPEKFVRNNAEAALTKLAKAAKAEALKAKLINWVEKYFSENYRDITARKTIEWGVPESMAGGNLSIRYKYLATIRNKSRQVIEERFTFTPEGKYVSAETIERRPAPLPEAVKRVQKVIVEDLATQMLVAIRDKDDAALKAMATDRIKGWIEALPKFALEMRERCLQKTGKLFQMFAGESVVLGNVAAVKCTGPKELKGVYLALFFIKTEGGWKNFCLRNSPPTIPLATHLRKAATEIGVQLPAAVDAAAKKETENLAVEGWRLWNARKLSEAEEKFKAAVAKDPTSANAFNGLGWAMQNQGKALNATDAFEKALAINPKLPGALNGLGWIAKSQGKPGQAIEYWQKAVAADPKTTAALNGLATTFVELGQYDKAAEACQLWLKAEPKSADAKAALKKAQDAAGASKEALSAAEQWLKLVDDGKYGASWDAASARLRKAVTQDTFAKQIQAARKPLGKAQSRKVMSAIFMTAMPGAPDGQYVTVQFEAVFANKKQAVETITPMKCEDGKWRVSGYYIK